MCKGFALDEMFVKLLNNISLNYSLDTSLFLSVDNYEKSEVFLRC